VNRSKSRVRSFYIIECTNWMNLFNTVEKTRKQWYTVYCLWHYVALPFQFNYGERNSNRNFNSFSASAAYAALVASCFCLVRPGFCSSHLPSVTYRIYFFHFARIIHGFWWNSLEVITTTKRLNVYILREIGTGTEEINLSRC